MIPGLSSGSSVSLPDSLMDSLNFRIITRFQNKFNPFLDEGTVIMDDAMPDHEVISIQQTLYFAPDNIHSEYQYDQSGI